MNRTFSLTVRNIPGTFNFLFRLHGKATPHQTLVGAAHRNVATYWLDAYSSLCTYSNKTSLNSVCRHIWQLLVTLHHKIRRRQEQLLPLFTQTLPINQTLRNSSLTQHNELDPNTEAYEALVIGDIPFSQRWKLKYSLVIRQSQTYVLTAAKCSLMKPRVGVNGRPLPRILTYVARVHDGLSATPEFPLSSTLRPGHRTSRIPNQTAS
jgi:hypothetical protein